MFIASNSRVLKHLKHKPLTLFPSEIGQAVTVFSVPADTQHVKINTAHVSIKSQFTKTEFPLTLS